jgi:hypothetical protein
MHQYSPTAVRRTSGGGYFNASRYAEGWGPALAGAIYGFIGIGLVLGATIRRSEPERVGRRMTDVMPGACATGLLDAARSPRPGYPQISPRCRDTAPPDTVARRFADRD